MDNDWKFKDFKNGMNRTNEETRETHACGCEPGSNGLELC